MATYEKRSGSWRARCYYYDGGRRISKSFTAPTKAEVMRLATEFEALKEKPAKDSITVRKAVEEYIKISEVLSPTTLQAYKRTLEYAFQPIMDLNAYEITDKEMQVAINQEAKRCNAHTGKQISAKTVKNEWGLVSASLKAIIGKTYSIKLPKVQRKNEDLPDPKLILDAISGTEIELPCLLAMQMSLRMSEIRGLMCSSVKDGVLYIDQVVVDVDNKEVTKKMAKTDTSIRKLQIPPYIMGLIEALPNYQEWLESGCDSRLLPFTRNTLHHRYTKLMEANGIDLSFHDLRHVYASVCLNILQLPEKVVMDNGGWKTSAVMKRVYSQSFSQVRKESDEKVSNYFDSLR